MTDKIAIIGFGNIASAIVTPLLDNKLIQPENVFCVVNSEKSLENIKKNYKHNINVYRSGSDESKICLLYTSPSPRDKTVSRMPSSA